MFVLAMMEYSKNKEVPLYLLKNIMQDLNIFSVEFKKCMMLLIKHTPASHYAKNLHKYVFGIVFLLAATSCFCQRGKKPKRWKATVFMDDRKMKGILSGVTDSSLVLLDRSHMPREILFEKIRKVRLVKARNQWQRSLIGFGVGAITGAAVLSTSLSRGKEGEPAALSGVFGGIAGGLGGGLIGGAVAPGIYNLFTAKKFRVVHAPAFYRLLEEKLWPYTLRNR